MGGELVVMLYWLESNDKKGNLYIGHRCSRMNLQG